MKTIIKKAVIFLLIIPFCILFLTACPHPNGIDKTKTQLYVNTYYAGLGDAWIQEYKRGFEEFYKNYSFESGKKGVQVMLDYSYASGMDTIAGLANTSTEVIWCEAVPYHGLVSAGFAYDISDITSQPLTEFGEDRSIQDKMDEGLLKYYKAYDGKVYAIPHFDYFRCIVYDIDVFESEGLYFAEAGGFTTGKAGAPAKAKGPDNKPGTYDDGLPQTYEQFFDMLDQMLLKGVTPFMWPGAYNDADTIPKSLWVNFEGKEQIELNFTYNGTANDLITVNADGTVNRLPPTAISNNNAYELFRQEGRYRALEFTKRLVNESRYYSNYAFSGSQSHVQAEEDFLYNIDPSKEKIAMLVTGVWWEEEASSIFDSMVESYKDGEKYSRKNRRFGMMPMPHYDDAYYNGSKIGQKNTLMTDSQTLVYINKNIKPEKVEVAKKFLQFTSTDPMILKHFETISVPRSLNCEIDYDALDNMSTFARSVLEIRMNSDVVGPFSENRFQWHTGYNFDTMGFAGTLINNNTYWAPVATFKDRASITPKQYFDGMYAANQPKWANFISTYKG